MIKVQEAVESIVEGEAEALYSLTEGYMNMSSYAHRIKKDVEMRAKKPATITSIVVSLSRLRKSLRKSPPMIGKVAIKNITTRLPISEIIYENTSRFLTELDSLHKDIALAPEDFFTITLGPAEVDVICSSYLTSRVKKHFKEKPKTINDHLAAIGIAFDTSVFSTPNIFFSLLSVTARARINIEELVSTPTELIFIVRDIDFAKTVSLFSNMHREISPKGE